jgi:hypothetical protein
LVRGDAGFGVARMYDVCERLHLLYTFGLSSDEVLAQAVADLEQEQQVARREGRPAVPVQLFTGFRYQGGNWSHPR